jgi:hypothetical protein
MERIRELISTWTPFVFVVALTQIVLYHMSGQVRDWEPAFYSFLPLAFFFVAIRTHRMEGELRDIRKRVALLQGGSVGPHGTD